MSQNFGSKYVNKTELVYYFLSCKLEIWCWSCYTIIWSIYAWCTLDWIKSWFFVVFKIYCCTFVYSCAFVCWFVVVCSYDYNSTCIRWRDYIFDVAWVCCYDYKSDVIWVYYYCCNSDIGSIWSSWSSSIFCSSVCIYAPISIVINPYS
jgi:hypothetical protein